VKLQLGEDGQIYWFPDSCSGRVDKALAGPFERREAAYWWMIEYLEGQMKPERKQLWAACLQRAGGANAHVDHLLGIAMMCTTKLPAAFVLRSSSPIRELRSRAPRLDRKSLASGERAA
jgi:hypothetical protein